MLCTALRGDHNKDSSPVQVEDPPGLLLFLLKTFEHILRTRKIVHVRIQPTFFHGILFFFTTNIHTNSRSYTFPFPVILPPEGSSVYCLGMKIA